MLRLTRPIACAGYGIGGNTMTGEQKSLLIYGATRLVVVPLLSCALLTWLRAGSLATFFALFIAGYLLD